MAFYNALSSLFKRPEEEDYFSSFSQPVEQSRSGGIGPSPIAQDLLNRGQFEPLPSHTPAPTTGPMGPTKIEPDPGPWGNFYRQYARGDTDALIESTLRTFDPTSGTPMGGFSGSLDDVALRMGKPLGSISSKLERDPRYGNLRLNIRDTSPNTRNYLDPGDASMAGYIKFADNPVDDHLSVSMTYLGDDYRNTGLGGEMYAEAVKRAKESGYKGLASKPYLRNQFSNQIWDRPGITQTTSSRYPTHDTYDLMSEYIPRGKDWESSGLKNLFNLDKTSQPMLPEVREWLLDQMRNKSFKTAPPVANPIQDIIESQVQPSTDISARIADLQRRVSENKPPPLFDFLPYTEYRRKY